MDFVTCMGASNDPIKGGLVELCACFFIGCWMGLVGGRLLWDLSYDIRRYLVFI